MVCKIYWIAQWLLGTLHFYNFLEVTKLPKSQHFAILPTISRTMHQNFTKISRMLPICVTQNSTKYTVVNFGPLFTKCKSCKWVGSSKTACRFFVLKLDQNYYKSVLFAIFSASIQQRSTYFLPKYINIIMYISASIFVSIGLQNGNSLN